VSAGHGTHGLYVDRHSPVHAARPECKVLGAVAFVFAVVAAPREEFWAFGAFAAILVAVAVLARVPLSLLARRLVIELPFLAFAFFLPFVGRGPRVDVLGVSLSTSGLWGAWNILAKGTLGVATAALLVATTPIASLLSGLDRLRVPRVMTAITGFMVRYLDVVGGELKRMNIARRSRGHDPRWFWQARAVASTAGSLFVRSFERGERVHLAMVSRGYTGRLPAHHETLEVGAATWLTVMSVPAAAATITAIAWLAR
jgi:cobalt/nickel transport system permease protein